MNASTTCLCGHVFEGPVVTGPLVTDHIVCPKCGKACVVGRIASYDIHAGNRHFYGEQSRSLMQGCHADEVPLLKRIVGPDLESCVKSTGDVVFKNRKQERAFAKAMDDARIRNAAQPGCFLSARAQARDKKIAEKRARQAAMR